MLYIHRMGGVHYELRTQTEQKEDEREIAGTCDVCQRLHPKDTERAYITKGEEAKTAVSHMIHKWHTQAEVEKASRIP